MPEGKRGILFQSFCSDKKKNQFLGTLLLKVIVKNDCTARVGKKIVSPLGMLELIPCP